MIKKIMYGALMAFTMFSAIPLPFHGWDEEARPFMILFWLFTEKCGMVE